MKILSASTALKDMVLLFSHAATVEVQTDLKRLRNNWTLT